MDKETLVEAIYEIAESNPHRLDAEALIESELQAESRYSQAEIKSIIRLIVETTKGIVRSKKTADAYTELLLQEVDLTKPETVGDIDTVKLFLLL